MDSQNKINNFMQILSQDEDDDANDKRPFAKRFATAAADLKSFIKNDEILWNKTDAECVKMLDIIRSRLLE